ncbi:MAG: hypothetical protein HZC42_05690 [Candidatus Eisenbacteria bacterium]|nr:hypothetical protein [Candidatus Eisenbacteria bacterium]
MRVPRPMSLLFTLCCLARPVAAAEAPAPAGVAASRVVYVRPQYLPPAELGRVLGVRQVDARGVLEWQAPDGMHAVEVRRNDAANLLIFSGGAADVEAVEAMVRAADVAPRQIAVEARIVEVDESRTRDLGIDWSTLSTSAALRQEHARSVVERSTRTPYGPSGPYRDEATQDRLDVSSSAALYNSLKLLEEAGAATLRDAPRILTLNNRRATILDGQRVTYVTRYSSYANVFATDSMDAGLTLSVLPSLGESGYLTLEIRAELTTLRGDISGSPVKDGQIVENTVVVKDGETVLLGGFQRSTDRKVKRRFPVLGHALPFLFSREIVEHSRTQTFIAITPRVVDLAAAVDEKTRGLIEGK